LAQEKDYFDARGAEEAFGRLRHLYRLLGAEDNVGLFIGPRSHGYSQENREAMYRWFNRATGVSAEAKEPKLRIEEEETLRCTPKGQVADLKSRTVFSFTREKSQALGKRRTALSGDELNTAVTAALKLPERASAPEYRILRPSRGRRYPKPHATTYAVE